MQSRLFFIIVLVVALIAAAILLQPAVEETLAPELRDAWVGIEVAGSGVAVVGPVALEAGTPFELHAVLEARDRQDRPVYYTEATRLAFGGEEVPAETLTIWQRRRPIKVRWFTVEGRRPYVMLDADTGIDGFEFQEFLRSDWPVTWSVPGEIDAANDNHLDDGSAEKVQRFGTQRFHVRFELYRDEDSLIPEEVIRSPGVAELKPEIDRFPTVRMTLPGPAAAASRVFGLAQLEPPPGAGRELAGQIEELADNGIAYSRLTVLRDQIREAGRRPEDLGWTRIDFGGATRWDVEAGPGDLLRVGDRVVVLYKDLGTPGVVDPRDLCFDYVQGAAVRALGDVFVGSGNDVELASLGGAAPAPPTTDS